jgi:hypothetical protein
MICIQHPARPPVDGTLGLPNITNSDCNEDDMVVVVADVVVIGIDAAGEGVLVVVVVGGGGGGAIVVVGISHCLSSGEDGQAVPP